MSSRSMTRLVVVPLVVLSMLLSFGVFGLAAEKKGGDLTIAVEKDPRSLDPTVVNDIASSTVQRQIFDTMVAFDESNNVIPHVATSWENPEPTVWVFHLRKGVKFHNGDELTAEDVKFSYDRGRDPKSKGQNVSKLNFIESIEVLDRYTVKFNLKFAYAPMLEYGVYEIVPKKVVEKMGDDFGFNPIGSGPFKFVEWVKDDHITLVKNENYWLKDVNLNKVTFRPIPEKSVAVMELEAGGIDIVQNVPADDVPRLEKNKNTVISNVVGINYFYVGINTRKEGPLANPKVRQAIAYGVDMDAIIESIFQGIGGSRAYSAVSFPNFWAFDQKVKDQRPTYNPTKAKQLLKEAGYANGFTTTIYTPQDPARRKIGELMQAYLMQIGIKLEVKSLEWAAYLPLLDSGEAPMMALGFNRGTDPDNYLYSMFHSDKDAWENKAASFNNSQYYNPEVDRLLEEARQIADQGERAKLYNKAQEIIFLEDVVHIPGYHRNEVAGYRSYVKDFQADPFGRVILVSKTRNVSLNK